MAGNFEIDEDGLVKARIGIRGIRGRRDRVVHLVNRAGIAAYATMKIEAPAGKTGAFRRSIDKTRPHFLPGGAGGGGTWTVVVGTTATPDTRAGRGFYPTNVFQGTGVFGPAGVGIKTAPGNVMVIKDWRKAGFRDRDVDRGTGTVLGGRSGRLTGRPGIIFTHHVEGQRPQRDWYDHARDRAETIISSNMHRIFNVNDAMDDI